MFEDTHLQQIRDRLGIVELVSRYVELKKAGRSFKGLCPFHNEKSPSFVVSPDKGLAYCFGCNQGGDIFKFMQLIEACDFPEAVSKLADSVGVELPKQSTVSLEKIQETKTVKEQLVWLHRAAVQFYQKQLQSADGESVQVYLQQRGLSAAVIQQFALGYAPKSKSAFLESLPEQVLAHQGVLLESGLFTAKDLAPDRLYDRFKHRLMIPILSERGIPIAFGGRILDPEQQPKYLNSPETPLYNKSRVLYGMSFAKEEMRKQRVAYIVEGYFDVLACHQVGVTNVMATCGTALTETQTAWLSRFCDTIVFGFDNDKAGKAALLRGAALALQQGLQVRVLQFADKDAGDMVVSDPQGLKTLLDAQGVTFLEWIIAEESVMAPDLVTRGAPEYVSDFFKRYVPLFGEISSAAVRDAYVRRLAHFLGIEPRMMYFEIEQFAQKKRVHLRPQTTTRVAVPEEKSFVFSLSTEDLLWGYLFTWPEVLEKVWEDVSKIAAFLQLNQVYKALEAFYNATRNWADLQLENLDITTDCLARLQKIVLFLETQQGDRSTLHHVVQEVSLLLGKLAKESKEQRLETLKRQIQKAEQIGEKQQIQDLLLEYSRLLAE